MSLIEWNDNYSVNIAEIDKQHKRLFDLINEIYDAMKQRKTQEILGKAIAQLVNYTKTHFSYEENILDKYSYPALSNQKKEHELFVAKILDFEDGFNENRLFLSTEITNFLKDWLITHIQGADKNYSNFLNNKGIV